MPHIDWKHLPRSVREHLRDRQRTREITEDDLVKLMNWASTNPEVPDGPWCKDFGSFKLVGHGAQAGTLLEKDQPCFGTRI
jgi:hypothetical protein